MKDLEQLLKQQFEGSITPEEEMLLNQLTNRDQVLANAQHRAQYLRRRQFTRACSVCAVVLIGGIFAIKQLQPTAALTEGPVLAATHPTAVEAPDSTADETLISEDFTKEMAAIHSAPQPSAAAAAEAATPAAAKSEPESKAVMVSETLPTTASTYKEETIVACNSHCSPDSVISDIWNFLHA